MRSGNQRAGWFLGWRLSLIWRDFRSRRLWRHWLCLGEGPQRPVRKRRRRRERKGKRERKREVSIGTQQGGRRSFFRCILVGVTCVVVCCCVCCMCVRSGSFITFSTGGKLHCKKSQTIDERNIGGAPASREHCHSRQRTAQGNASCCCNCFVFSSYFFVQGGIKI